MQTQDFPTKKLDSTGLKDSTPKSLLDLFQEQLRTRPDSEAVVSGDECITYRELAEVSSRLSSYLQYLGVSTDECIGIFVDPSLELVIGIWGVLFSGSAYLPLSPEYPEERLSYMVEDAKVKIVFSCEKLRNRLEELAPHGTKIVTLEDLDKVEVPSDIIKRDQISQQPHPSNLAYVIYTSGSTGKPKGVMIEHHSIVNQLDWLRDTFELDHSKVILQKTPASFDAAQWEILASCFGSKLIMSTPGAYKDPELLIETIIRHDVTTLQCVPTLLQALLDTEIFHNCQSLKRIFSGGEILSKELAIKCNEIMPGCDLTNVYGPTECTINSTSFTVDRDKLADYSEAIPIGTSAKNVQLYILDSTQSPVSSGKTGEIYVGGVQLARGYLDLPDKTKEAFITNDAFTSSPNGRLYRTGDLAYWNEDGTAQFVSRVDNQVKLRGYRIELDEVRLTIEQHDWVQNAAAIVKKNSRTGYPDLIACIELSANQAKLMDQGEHGEHHLSKKNKLQVKVQLSDVELRDDDDISSEEVFDLPGKTPTEAQRKLAFSRKSYRFFEGAAVEKADLMRLLDRRVADGAGDISQNPRDLSGLNIKKLGEVLRYFGQFDSEERLLPKYGYASPGALYATQLYLELVNIADLPSGYYSYHPKHHQLILVNKISSTEKSKIKLHFIGKEKAIKVVYKRNVEEVLEMETGHMLGLFDKILPAYQLGVGDLENLPAMKQKLIPSNAPESDYYYLGTFELLPELRPWSGESVDLYVQSHPDKIADLPAGQYKYSDGQLEKISDKLILKKHVIAINQRTYEQASFGISMIGRCEGKWENYIALGRMLQHLQQNEQNIGLLSSGYSSETGYPLPSAKQINKILSANNEKIGPSYFGIGGCVSNEQLVDEGMKEDSIHMKGPAELVKDDIRNFLPDYMMPNRIVVMNEIPLTANGKIDNKALADSDQVNVEMDDRAIVEPRTETEKIVSEMWKDVMKWDSVSVKDDFFQSGGNSLIAVNLINTINREFKLELPLNTLFEALTIEGLANIIESDNLVISSRFVGLSSTGKKNPVYCWPGLGGYPMSLGLLADNLETSRPFYGVQAHGINQGESPFASISEMATEDIKEIKRLQPDGPYMIWGYSFGARVAFEVAHQLEQSGDGVENLFLIAPGSPHVEVSGDNNVKQKKADFSNKAYVTILFSVFSRRITGTALEECLRVSQDEDSFASFIARHKKLDADLVKRIVKIVQLTYEAKYTFAELEERQITAPITIFKAKGDDYSFIESHSGYSQKPPTVIDLTVDHYSLLKISGVSDLTKAIRQQLKHQPTVT